MNKLATKLLLLTATATIVVSAPASAQTAGPTAAPAAVAPDPAAVAAMIASLNTVLDAQPAKASSTDIEAALVYVIDQTQQPKAVILAALDGLDLTKRTPAAKAAVIRLRRKIAKAAGRTGTGGIGSPAGTTLGAGPSVGGGANGTDYSPNP